MHFLRVLSLVALSLYPFTLISTGCGSSDSGGSSAGSGAGGAGTTDTSTSVGAAGTGGAAGGAGAGGATGSGGSGGTAEMVDVTQTPCFTLATATANANNPCDGDLYFLSGVNVDLGAGASGTPYCLPATGVPAPAASLADVPSDYSTCTWSGYVEGGSGLANTGFIVRDAAALHHYRMHITSNTLPTLVFEYAKID